MPSTHHNITPEMAAAVEHWPWVEDQLHPIPAVTAERYSEEWMEQVDTRNQMRGLREVAERRYIKRMYRTNRWRIIDKLRKETQ